jgi:hypothetical protein
MSRASFLGFGLQRPMSLFAVMASVCGTAVLGGACTVNNAAAPATGDAGPGTPGADGGTDAPPGSASPLGFVPSNISLSGVDLTMAGDSDIATLCELDTEPGPRPVRRASRTPSRRSSRSRMAARSICSWSSR